VARRVLGKREDRDALQEGSVDTIWAFVRKSELKSKYNVKPKEFLTLMKHIKDYFEQF